MSFITIVIVNFNTSDFINMNLYSLFNLTFNDFKVIICDNGSTPKDIENLEQIIIKYKNVELMKRTQSKFGSLGHGEALNTLIKKIDTPYGVILDADAIFLMKNWDKLLIEQLNENIKIIGTPPVKNPIKKTDFPSVYATLFETNAFKSLNIDMRPENISKGEDTGWEMRAKFNASNFESKILEVKSTREYKKGPFKKIICAEYYLKNYSHIFASHFGRGATLGNAKYRGFIYKIPLLCQTTIKLRGQLEKYRWLKVCKKIINNEINKI